MKNIVISLAAAHDRRTHIRQEFGKQDIDFEFFDAVTPNQVAELSKLFDLDLSDAFLTDGEKACLMSHVCLWQKCLDDGLEYLAIFEDDVYLGENAHLFFSDSKWLKTNQLDLIKTETFLQKRKLEKNVISVMDNRTLHALKENHLGAAGYILSQNAARILINILKELASRDIKPVDVIMFEDLIKTPEIMTIYQLLPAICVQEFIFKPNTISMPSSLEDQRLIMRKQKPKRSIGVKLKGELSNAVRKTFGQFIRTKVEFR